jgi:sulfite exporter TauE/SafE/copper chaperone CopZ
MSRRRDRARAQAARSTSPVANAHRDEAAVLHEVALERRQARTQLRAPGASPVEASDEGVPAPAGPVDLHARAIELREYRMGRGPRPAGLDAPTTVITAEGIISVTFPVIGMTCRSCEVRIGKHVGRIPGVERVSASAVRGQVRVESSVPVSAAAIERAINKAGYEIGRTPWLESDLKVWATAGAGVLLVAVLAVMAQVTGLGDLASGAGDLSQGGLVVALLLGLAAGVSTCMALVGGLVLGLSASFQAGRAAYGAAPLGAAAQMRPALVFVGGRIAGYAVFGAVLGAIGASVTMPPQLTAILMITVAVVMILLGTRLTGLSPRIAGWSPTLPMGLGSRLGLGGGTAGAYSHRRAATLGAASFFLPCGFTQAIQIYALSTGSPLFAAALLGTFAIGTAPGLLAIAGLPVVVPSRAKPTLLRLVGVVVLGFAVMNGSAGIRLSGFSLDSLVGIVSAAPLPGTLGADGIQRITTFQDAGGYSPGNIVIYAGYPTKWTIKSSNTSTCAASLFVPGLDIRTRLKKGSNTFDVPALRPGTLNYTCAMGMYGGKITVVARPAQPGASPAGG